MTTEWHFWADDPPPLVTRLQATYSLAEEWMDGETCGRPCRCFYADGMGHMSRPNFWRLPPRPPLENQHDQSKDESA